MMHWPWRAAFLEHVEKSIVAPLHRNVDPESSPAFSSTNETLTCTTYVPRVPLLAWRFHCHCHYHWHGGGSSTVTGMAFTFYK
jgi:hypothetical protein